MRPCEFEAKKILAAHDIPIPKGKLATSSEEAEITAAALLKAECQQKV